MRFRLIGLIAVCWIVVGETAVRADVLDKAPLTASPKDLIALAKKIPVKDSPAVVTLLESVRLRFDDKGRRTLTIHRIYKILSADGVSGWSQTGASWAPWHQNKPTIRARVIAADGSVHRLRKSDLIEDKQPSGSDHLYSDRRTLRAPLPSTAVGVIVEEEIVTRDHRRYFDSGELYSFYVGSTVPWHRARFVIDAPRKLRVKTKVQNVEGVKRRVAKRRGRVITTFTKKDIPPYERLESHLAPDDRRYSRITASTGSWKAMAKQYSGVVDGAIAAGPVATLIKQLEAAKASDRDARIKAALKLVSDNVRYTGLELGESAIIPFSPAETWKRKYGDCKDKATLLVALLRGLGVKAHVALIRSSFSENIEPTMPGLGAFNHAIVYVEKSKTKPAVWIDPTEELAGVGDLPQSDQGRFALIARIGESAVVKTPILAPGKNSKHELRELVLPEQGKAKLTETTIFRGASEVAFRRYIRDGKPSEIKKQFETYLGVEYKKATLVDQRYGKPSSLAAPFELRLVGKDVGYAEAYRNEASVYLDLSRVFDQLPSALTATVGDDEKPRKRAMFVFPHTREVIWKIRAPIGFDFRPPPSSTVERFGPSTLAISYNLTGRELAVGARFQLADGRFKPSDVLALRRRVNEASKNDVNLELDQVGMRAMQADKLKEAATEIRKLIRLHPKEALHHIQLSEIYLAAGLGGPARKEARRAVKLEPRSGEAHGWLGYVLARDEVGRWLAPGSDKKRATAAFRKAIKLAPKESWLRQNLAVILEYSAAGVRYDGDLDQAIKVYQANRKETGEKGYDHNLLVALFRAKRWKEALALSREMEQRAEMRGLRAGAAMMVGGVKQLDREVSKIGGQPAASFAGASLELVWAGEYAKAAAVYDRGIRSGAISEAQRSYHKFLTGMRRYRPSKATPANLATLLASAAVLRSPRAEDLVVPTLIERDPVVNMRTIDRGNVSEHFVVDMVASIAKSKVEHVPAWGYRVQMTMDAPGSAPAKWTLYARKKRGKLRIVGVDGWSENVALGALELVKKKKLKAARTLIGWLAEASVGNPSLKTLAKDLDTSPSKELTAAAVAALDFRQPKAAVTYLRNCSKIRSAKVDACHRILSAMALFAGDFELARKNTAAVAVRPSEKMVNAIFRGLIEQRAGKTAAADKILAEVEASEGRTAKLIHTMADFAVERGELDRALKLYKESSDKKATSETANMIAWLSLFKDVTSDSTLDQLRAAEGEGSRSYNNTLAAAYAVRGRLKAARAALVASVAGVRTNQPRDHLVLGRIAAELGLKKEARLHYKKATRKTKTSPQRYNTSDLAKKWMKEL